MPYNAEKNEQEVLKYWDEHKCFEKSVTSRPEKKPYVFYDGPPFATGLPHYGHILSSVIKDVVPRYWTMKGYRVRRRWGWDCHGLPIENLVEKELTISGKKDIEGQIGVAKFNETCRSKVLMYTKEWKKMINRIGRWIEFDNAYKTMDSTYMESVWWALKTIWNKGLIYEGRKVLLYCPRCETPVSKAEVAMDDSYKTISEETVIVKFKIKNKESKIKNIDSSKDIFILAWTTTPWTLPGNVALAVGENIEYWVVDIEGENGSYILAKNTAGDVLKGKNYKKIKEIRGSDLVGVEYEPLFDIAEVREKGKKAWYVAAADFVTTTEGTGVVHTAVVYGEDDYNLGVKLDLPVVPLLDEKGHFNEYAPKFIQGLYFKKAEKEIKEKLETSGLIFKKEYLEHEYPHCWRCDTQLFYNAISAWFINIQKIKNRMIKLNEKINWYPEHLKHGRFLNILETAPDWNISRNRYWATPLPFWKCGGAECDNTVCVGSVEELQRKAINFDEVYATAKVEEMDLHKHLVDKIKLKCDKCGSVMARIPEVIDCWVESASMPFAEFHYPFENKDIFKARFPGQYIAEYIAQTRAWFYYMHAMAVLLFDDISFKNCVTTGTILNENGEKLSKSKRNYTDPWVIIEQYGVDALRYYLMTGVVMQAENLFFNDRELRDVYNKVVNLLWNVVEFYEMYGIKIQNLDVIPSKAGILPAAKDSREFTLNLFQGGNDSKNVLDRWILAKLQNLVEEATDGMDNYDTVKAGRPIKDFINDLSTWYVRRSRDRFKGEDADDKADATAALGEVLTTLAKVIAPFTPFIAEKIYIGLGGPLESVHLEEWPKVNKKHVDEKVLEQMATVRKIVEMGLALRAEKGIKVRQPLFKLSVIFAPGPTMKKLEEEYLNIAEEELNVKEIEIAKRFDKSENMAVKEDGDLTVGLNTEITDSLKKEGAVREITRAINQMRKEQKLTTSDRVSVFYGTEEDFLKNVMSEFAREIKRSVLADELSAGDGGAEHEIGGMKIKLELRIDDVA